MVLWNHKTSLRISAIFLRRSPNVPELQLAVQMFFFNLRAFGELFRCISVHPRNPVNFLELQRTSKALNVFSELQKCASILWVSKLHLATVTLLVRIFDNLTDYIDGGTLLNFRTFCLNAKKFASFLDGLLYKHLKRKAKFSLFSKIVLG